MQLHALLAGTVGCGYAVTVDQMWAMKVNVLDTQVALKGEGTSPVVNGWH